MEYLIFWAFALAVAVFLGYKIGKWSKEWEMVMLQDDNVKLSGEVYRLKKEVDKANVRFVKEIFSGNSTTKEKGEQLWD
jgi:hypothetical protein